MSRECNPIYAQAVGDLGLAIQYTAPLCSGLIVPRVVIAEGNSHLSHVIYHVISLSLSLSWPLCMCKAVSTMCIANVDTENCE